MHGPQQPLLTLTVSPLGQAGGRLLHVAPRVSQLLANVQRPSVHLASGANPFASQALLAQARLQVEAAGAFFGAA
jgi:hypothetical protein